MCVRLSDVWRRVTTVLPKHDTGERVDRRPDCCCRCCRCFLLETATVAVLPGRPRRRRSAFARYSVVRAISSPLPRTLRTPTDHPSPRATSSTPSPYFAQYTRVYTTYNDRFAHAPSHTLHGGLPLKLYIPYVNDGNIVNSYNTRPVVIVVGSVAPPPRIRRRVGF